MKTKGENILMIIPNLGYGGAEKSFSKLSLDLSKKYTVYVSVFNTDSYSTEKYEHGGTFINMNVTSGVSLYKKINAFRERIKKIKKIKSEYKITATISFLEGADYINILSGGKDRKILSIRGSKLHDKNIKGLTGFFRKKILIPYLYRKADCIVTVNEGISSELKIHFGLKDKVPIRFIPNYYDIEQLTIQANHQSNDLSLNGVKQFSISTAGRLSDEKGFIELLDVFNLVKKELKNVILLIIGDGIYIKKLQKHCLNNGLTYSLLQEKHKIDKNTDVIFTGYQQSPASYISQSSVYVLASFTEGFPNTLIEAMASNTPVIATDCPWGPRYILQGEKKADWIKHKDGEFTNNGVLVPIFSSEENKNLAARAIIRLLKQTELQNTLVNNSKTRLLDFSRKNVLTLWYNAIENK